MRATSAAASAPCRQRPLPFRAHTLRRRLLLLIIVFNIVLCPRILIALYIPSYIPSYIPLYIPLYMPLYIPIYIPSRIAHHISVQMRLRIVLREALEWTGRPKSRSASLVHVGGARAVVERRTTYGADCSFSDHWWPWDFVFCSLVALWRMRSHGNGCRYRSQG